MNTINKYREGQHWGGEKSDQAPPGGWLQSHKKHLPSPLFPTKDVFSFKKSVCLSDQLFSGHNTQKGVMRPALKTKKKKEGEENWNFLPHWGKNEISSTFWLFLPECTHYIFSLVRLYEVEIKT